MAKRIKMTEILVEGQKMSTELISKDFKKSLREYIWVIASICLAYSIAALMTPWFEEILKESFASNEFQGRAIKAILSSTIFALIFLHQEGLNLFLFLALGFFAAMQHPQQTYFVVSCTQFLGVGYFVLKYSHRFVREWLVAAKRRLKSKEVEKWNSFEQDLNSIFALGPCFALVVLAKEVIQFFLQFQ